MQEVSFFFNILIIINLLRNFIRFPQNSFIQKFIIVFFSTFNTISNRILLILRQFPFHQINPKINPNKTMSLIVNYENVLKNITEPSNFHIKEALETILNAIHLYE